MMKSTCLVKRVSISLFIDSAGVDQGTENRAGTTQDKVRVFNGGEGGTEQGSERQWSQIPEG